MREIRQNYSLKVRMTFSGKIQENFCETEKFSGLESRLL